MSIQDVVLSQGKPRDAAVNFDTYRIFKRHRAFLRHSTAFLYRPTSATIRNPASGLQYRDKRTRDSNAESTQSTLIFTAVTQNHGDSRKSRHTTDNIDPW